jgi:hypothetical protein
MLRTYAIEDSASSWRSNYFFTRSALTQRINQEPS